MEVQQIPPCGIHTAGGEKTGHYPGSHCMEPAMEMWKEFEREANLEIDKWLEMNEHCETESGDSLGEPMRDTEMEIEEYEFDNLAFEEKVCNELLEMNVLDISVNELETWMNLYDGVQMENINPSAIKVGSEKDLESSSDNPPHLGADMGFACKNRSGWKSSQARLTSKGSVPECKQKADSKPGGGLETYVYESGTWLIDGWLGKSSQPSSSGVGCGKNHVLSVSDVMDRSSHPSPVRVGSGKILVCTHMLGCAANMCDMENGPDKQIPDILRGSYLCSTGWSKKRKRAKPWGSCRIQWHQVGAGQGHLLHGGPRGGYQPR